MLRVGEFYSFHLSLGEVLRKSLVVKKKKVVAEMPQLTNKASPVFENVQFISSDSFCSRFQRFVRMKYFAYPLGKW